MVLRVRPFLLLLLLPLLATCQAQVQRGASPAVAAIPMINPLPIPDAPSPRITVPREEPRAIRLLVNDNDLAEAICRDGTGLLPAQGRLFGHQRHAEPRPYELAQAPAPIAGGSCQLVHRAMLHPLMDMVAAANRENPEVGRAIIAISCYRSIERQADLFCEPGRVAQRGYAGQARWIAPPGYSEHATGLSIDFGSRREDGCNLRPCFADTAVGRWLVSNAARFGFEMSFPADNQQGVAHEPWHYRYVRANTLPVDQWTNRATTSR
jgi:hypothetical protein